MEQRKGGFSWSEMAIVAVMLVTILGITSMSTKAMIRHAKARRTHMHSVVNR